jgi:flagellar biosynthesis anti-sigma factor FlgM
MNIYQIGKKGLEIAADTVKSSRKPSKHPEKAGTPNQDRVRLSKDVLRLLEIEKQAKEPGTEGVRAEIVEKMQQRIREGTYAPDSKKVADKLLAQALQEAKEE